jgi:Ras-related protein Rab-1A
MNDDNDKSIEKNFVKYRKVGIFGSKNVGKKTFCNFLYKHKKEEDNNNDDMNKSSYSMDDSPFFYENFEFVYESKNYYINLLKLDINMSESQNICFNTYLYEVQILILVLDITNIDSFEDIQKFIETNKNIINFNNKIFLISNKSDLESSRSVSDFDIKKITSKFKNIISINCNFSELENKIENNNEKFLTQFLENLNSHSLIYIHKPILINNSNYNENKLKIILIGDSSVGKTAFIKKIFENKFFFSYMSTIGVDNQKTLIKINDKIIKLEVWDTAGQERLKAVSRKIYNKGDGFLLLFDLTKESSFTGLKENWLKEIENETNIKDNNNNVNNNSNKKLTIFIIGNKFDLTDERVIQYEEAKKFADENNCKYMEMSCLSGLNVYEILCEIAIESFKNYKNDINSFMLDNKQSDTKKSRKKKWC